MKIGVRDLAHPCVTRRVGRRAFEKLEGMNPRPPLALDLSGVRLLSASFLDEIVLCLRKRQWDGGLHFIIGRASDLRKLKFVARTRKFDLKYVEKEGDNPKPVLGRA